MMKIYPKCVALTLLTLCSVVTSNAQNSTQANDFSEMRKKEFSNLIGGPTQNGVNVSYNSDKTSLEGAGTFGKNSSSHLFQLKGSVGTSTNLSSLFNQKVLPSLSGSFSWNFLLKGWPSRWFYDGGFEDNFAKLNDGSVPLSQLKANSPLAYKEALREKVQAGKIDALKTKVYSFKRFSWLSLTGKYDNTKYSFYDAGRVFAQQLYEPTYQSWTLKGALNGYYTWNKEDFKWGNLWGWRPNFIYFNLALQYGLGNNIQQLKKTTVNDVSATQVEGSTTRQTVKSYTAYNGIYKEYNTFTPSFDFILAPIKSFAVNAFGDYNMIADKDKIKNGVDNYGSIAVGGYYYGSGNTKINIGVYYKWTRDNAADTWTEQIGLRTTIPITPN